MRTDGGIPSPLPWLDKRKTPTAAKPPGTRCADQPLPMSVFWVGVVARIPLTPDDNTARTSPAAFTSHRCCVVQTGLSIPGKKSTVANS